MNYNIIMTCTCVVAGCNSESYPGCGKAFHRIPQNEEIRDKWIDAIPVSKSISQHSVVCSVHFKDEDYRTKARSQLRDDAVPSLFDGCKQRSLSLIRREHPPNSGHMKYFLISDGGKNSASSLHDSSKGAPEPQLFTWENNKNVNCKGFNFILDDPSKEKTQRSENVVQNKNLRCNIEEPCPDISVSKKTPSAQGNNVINGVNEKITTNDVNIQNSKTVIPVPKKSQNIQLSNVKQGVNEGVKTNDVNDLLPKTLLPIVKKPATNQGSHVNQEINEVIKNNDQNSNPKKFKKPADNQGRNNAVKKNDQNQSAMTFILAIKKTPSNMNTANGLSPNIIIPVIKRSPSKQVINLNKKINEEVISNGKSTCPKTDNPIAKKTLIKKIIDINPGVPKSTAKNNVEEPCTPPTQDNPDQPIAKKTLIKKIININPVVTRSAARYSVAEPCTPPQQDNPGNPIVKKTLIKKIININPGVILKSGVKNNVKKPRPTPKQDKPENISNNNNSKYNGYCSMCKGPIDDAVYWCVQCAGTCISSCGACSAQSSHSRHYVLRVPPDKPYDEIKQVVDTIRRVLSAEIKSFRAEANLADNLLNEIKSEVVTEGEVDPCPEEPNYLIPKYDACNSEDVEMFHNSTSELNHVFIASHEPNIDKVNDIGPTDTQQTQPEKGDSVIEFLDENILEDKVTPNHNNKHQINTKSRHFPNNSREPTSNSQIQLRPGKRKLIGTDSNRLNVSNVPLKVKKKIYGPECSQADKMLEAVKQCLERKVWIKIERLSDNK